MRISTLIILVLLLGGCATSPTGRSQLMLISPEKAIAESRQAYVQTMQPLAREGKIDSNPEQARRIRLITGRIIGQAVQLFPQSSSWDWSIKVIDDPKTVNAWCMAGGKMAIYTGLLNKIKPSDDELAQVMAHEISHALANHTAERMSVVLASQLGVLGLGLATADSDYGGLATTGGALAAMLAINLPNSREAETEADLMGIELAARAGYNPYAAATLWDKMEKAGGASPIEFLSTHPAPVNRKIALTNLAPRYMPYYLAPGDRPIYQFHD